MIKNGANSSLSQINGVLPDVSGALRDWFVKMVFTRVTKVVKNAVVKETGVEINFMGVWQPFGAQALMMKPEGQRAWKWFMVHAEPELSLIPDEVITYQGTAYRVKEKFDYNEYGYIEYHLVQDYTGSGPAI